MAQDERTYRAKARKKLADMIRHRSIGRTIMDTAERLGLMPWELPHLTRIIRVIVSADELRYMEEEADRHGFSTVGELIMDVFNRTYENHYLKMRKSKKKKAG